MSIKTTQKILLFCFIIFSFCTFVFALDSQGDSNSVKRTKAPFKVLFDNDFTNTTNCISPYYKGPEKEHWKVEHLVKSVEETANTGIEVHLLQPASTWVPWWPSKIYPMAEHRKWWKQNYGTDIIDDVNGKSGPEKYVNEYLLQGGDPFKYYIEACNQANEKPFISIRLNDGHHKEFAFKPGLRTGTHTTCKFYVDHPDYILGKGHGLSYSRLELLQNWAIPEVRNYKFSLIEEVCQNYDVSGIELDFMRHWGYFRMDETTSEQRVAIMTDFVRKVRQMLDKTSRDGQYRWLCVRIPCYTAYFDSMGLDPAKMYEAGVDMFNLSASYFTVQQTDMAKIKKMVPDAAVYLEMCHTTLTGKSLSSKSYDSVTFRRTTNEQYYTAAHLAYSRGLDGLSLFNFVYYRPFGVEIENRGPWNEPPFEICKHLNDPQWLAKQPQHYVWRVNESKLITDAGGKAPLLDNTAVATKFTKDKKATWNMDMAPPTGGWKKDGKFRIQSDTLLDSTEWSASINGAALKATNDVNEPYKTPYPQLLGQAGQHRGWIVPKEILKNGNNKIEVSMLKGTGSKQIVFIDLAIE
jgi:hypothetical protein